MRKIIAVGSIVSFVTSCVAPPPITIPQAQAICASQPFSLLGSCIRNQLNMVYPAWHSNAEADLADVYISWVEAAGVHVADGSMNEGDARLGAATVWSRMLEIRSQRQAISQEMAASQMLAGLALLNASHQQPSYGPVISCNTVNMGQFSSTTCR